MDSFWQWVQSRQDARQWSEDEKACAEIAWKEAIKLTEEKYETKLDRFNCSSKCSKCGFLSSNDGSCYCPGGVA